MSLVSHPKQWWSSKFAQWVRRRNPPSNTKRLTQRNVFIFPTKEGGFFALLLLLLLITAINYQSSLIYLFTFLLGALFIFSIIFCFKNMSGLQLSMVRAGECFAGENVAFSITLTASDHQDFESLVFVVSGEANKKVSVARSETVTLNLSRMSAKRGRLPLGRVRLETVYPLGLVRAWTFLEFEMAATVFPKPIRGERAPGHSVRADEDEGGIILKGEEALSGIRDYAHGDPPNRIAWKHYASKGELYVKEFDAISSSQQWLKYSDYQGGDKEMRLSYLCHDVLHYTAKGLNFGLELPSHSIEPSQGEPHRQACLRALARA